MPDIGSAVGGAIGLIGSKKSADAQKDAARQSSDAQVQAAMIAADAANPWSTTGPGGSYKVNEKNRSAKLALSGALNNIYGDYLARQDTWQPMIQDFISDPFSAQESLFGQLKEAYAPEQERQRLALEKRLLQQGLMGQAEGESGANPHMQALLEAQGMQDINTRNNAMSQVQGLIDMYLSRGREDLGTATGLLNIPLQYANVGNQIGGQVGSAGVTGANMRADAATNLAGAQSAAAQGMWGGLGSAIPQISKGINTVFNPASVSTNPTGTWSSSGWGSSSPMDTSSWGSWRGV